MASYDLLNEFIRQGSFAIDKSSVQTTLSAAEAYIASPTAYAGQLLAVTSDSTDNNGAYIVKGSGTNLYLEKIGTGAGSGSDIDGEEIILSVLETMRESIGLEPDYTYVNKPDPVVISGATDIKSAIFLLDDEFENVNNTFTSIENTITDINSDITNIYQTLTDLSDNKEDKGTLVYNTTSSGTDILTIEYNTSYIYANTTGFTSLTVDLTNVTGTPTSTETPFAQIAYEENVYFKAASNSTTLTVTNCNATCVFGQYTNSGTTYTFSGFTADMWYCLSVKENCVACGPMDETELSLVASSATDYGYIVTGLAVDDHAITYKHLDFTSTNANKYLAGDGHFKSIVSGVSGICSTASSTAAKTVSVSDFTLQTGVVVNVTFTNTNMSANATLNVGGSGAKSIYYNGAALSTYNDYLKGGLAGATITYVYDGTNWVWLSTSVDTTRQLCTFAGATNTINGYTLSGSSPNQTLTVVMYPNKTYYIGEYTSSITTLVLDITNVVQADTIHTPINYESIAHFYNGYTVRIKTGNTTVDAVNFTGATYGSYSDLPVNEMCFLSVADQIVTFGPAYVDMSATDGYIYPYTLPVASSSVLGGVKTGYTASGNNYSIGIDGNNKIYTTVPMAGRGTAGTMKYPTIPNYTPMASPQEWTVATTGQVYPIEVSVSNEPFVRVPMPSNSGGGGNVNIAETWLDGGTNAGITMPTLTIKEEFSAEGIVYGENPIAAPTGVWLPADGSKSYEWCALPVIMDTSGRLFVAFPISFSAESGISGCDGYQALG